MSSLTLKVDVQRGCGISTLGDAQNSTRHGPKPHAVKACSALRKELVRMTFRSCSYINYSTILTKQGDCITSACFDVQIHSTK